MRIIVKYFSFFLFYCKNSTKIAINQILKNFTAIIGAKISLLLYFKIKSFYLITMRMIPQDKQLNPNLGLYIGDLEDGVTEE